MSTIKHLKSTHESTNEKAKEDTRRKPATRANCIQKRILNDIPHLRRKPTEGEVQRVQYPTLHRIRRLRERLRLNANSCSTGLASYTGDRRCVHRNPKGNLHQQLDDSPPTQRKQQDQYQERSTTRRYHIAQAVHGSN